MLLKNIKFLKDFRCYKEGEEIDISAQLTVITGDNGSGKSTLLSCIRSSFKSEWSTSEDGSAKGVIAVDTASPEDIDIVYLCFSGDMLKYAASFGSDITLQVQTMHISSGEGALEQLIDKVENSVGKPLLILDEPEKGLSIKRVNLILRYLRKHAHDNPKQQMIVVTHSEILMRLAGDTVYSTSHKKRITAEAYLDWAINYKNFAPFA